MIIKRNILVLLISCLFVQGQSANDQQWMRLAEKSTFVLIGTATATLPVVRRDKVNNIAKKSREDIGALRIDEFIIGYIIRIKLNQVIKNESRTSLGKEIGIFLTRAQYVGHSTPLLEGEKALIFLSRLKEKDSEFKGATIFQSQAGEKKDEQFDPSSCYVIVDSTRGVARITTKNSKSIEEFAQEMKKAVASPNKK